MPGSFVGVVVVPLAIVNRNSHFLWISVVKVIRAAEIFLSPVVVGIVHVGIVIKPIPVMIAVESAPHATISTMAVRHLVVRGLVGNRSHLLLTPSLLGFSVGNGKAQYSDRDQR